MKHQSEYVSDIVHQDTYFFLSPYFYQAESFWTPSVDSNSTQHVKGLTQFQYSLMIHVNSPW